MKEPTGTKASVVLHKPESKEMGWGWCQIPLGLPRSVFFPRTQSFCCCNSFLSPSVCMNKQAEGGMLGLHPAPNLLAGHTKTNILRCQPVSSSAPTQRHKCLFKYQKHEDALVHLHTCEVSFLLFDVLVFLTVAVLMLTNPEVFILKNKNTNQK